MTYVRVRHREYLQRAHVGEHRVRQLHEPVVRQVEVLQPRDRAHDPEHFRRQPIVAEQQRRELRATPEEADRKRLEAIAAQVDDGGPLKVPAGLSNAIKAVFIAPVHSAE